MLAYFVILSTAVASDEFYLPPARHVPVRLTFRVQLSACSFDGFCDVPRCIIFLLESKPSIDPFRLDAPLGRMLQQGEERHEARLVAPLSTAKGNRTFHRVQLLDGRMHSRRTMGDRFYCLVA